jgi:hypothetical protein
MAEVCTCKKCKICHGSGTMKIPMSPDPGDYDIDDCPTCQGTGFSTICNMHSEADDA